MKTTKQQLKAIFNELDKKIEAINHTRHQEGLLFISRGEIKLLGQLSLLVDDKISMLLTLAQTADLDAWLTLDQIMKNELKEILKKQGWIYDEDSYLIWLPKDAKFYHLFDFKNVIVKSVDPESALVSKAVKAPEKNKQLVREAIASGHFPNLMDRIKKNGGDLEYFAKD